MKTLNMVFCLLLAGEGFGQSFHNIYSNAENAPGWQLHLPSEASGSNGMSTTIEEDGSSRKLYLAPGELYQNATADVALANTNIDLATLGGTANPQTVNLYYDFYVSQVNAPQALGFGIVYVDYQRNCTCKIVVQFDYENNRLRGWTVTNGVGEWEPLDGGQAFGAPRPNPGWNHTEIDFGYLGDGTFSYNHVNGQPVDTIGNCKAGIPPEATESGIQVFIGLSGNSIHTPYSVFLDRIFSDTYY